MHPCLIHSAFLLTLSDFHTRRMSDTVCSGCSCPLYHQFHHRHHFHKPLLHNFCPTEDSYQHNSSLAGVASCLTGGSTTPYSLFLCVTRVCKCAYTCCVRVFHGGCPICTFFVCLGLPILERFSNSNNVLVHRELLKDSQIFQERSLGSGSLDCNNKEAPGLLRPLEILFSCTSLLQTGFFWTICSAFSAYSICSCIGSISTSEMVHMRCFSN